MREIKFRAWDKENKCMIGDEDSEADFRFHAGSVSVKYLSEQFYEGGGEIHSRDKWEDCDVEVMQFTGLKDKNGKEVYEGDIVVRRYYHNNAPSKRPKINFIEPLLPIIFSDGRFDIDDSDIISSEYGTTYNNWWDNCEVIGNIYENKELLENDKNN